MTQTPDNGGPAFPRPTLTEDGQRIVFENFGLSIRDYFAAQCDITAYRPVESFHRAKGRMPEVKELADYIAEIRHIEADAMIAARKVQP